LLSFTDTATTEIYTLSLHDALPIYFAHNEKSVTLNEATTVSIQFKASNGETEILKNQLNLLKGEIIDATVLSKKALIEFLENQVKDAKDKGVLFSLHMKATMMKVSDPIIFGHAVKVFFKDLFAKHGDTFKSLGVDVNNGFGNLIEKLEKLPASKREEIEQDI